MDYCALCCIAKDEEWYIDEWIDYHLALGFDKIIIYDNHSRISLVTYLESRIAAGSVVVHETLGEALGETAQGEAYTHCMSTYKNAFMWIAVIDTDELVVLKKHINIKAFLAEFENYGGLLLNWRFYADARSLNRMSRSQILSFVYTQASGSTRGKSIVRPQRVADFTGSHGPSYIYPFYAVNTDHLPLEPCTYSGPFVDDAAQINHYWLRSKEDYARKTVMWKESGRIITETFESQAESYVVRNDCAVTFWELLRQNKQQPLPILFSTVADLTLFFMTAVQQARLRPHLEIMLANCMCAFPEEPLIWVFRSILARIQGQNDRAFRYIRQALKSSGSSTVYYELSRVYLALGDPLHSQQALIQAEYKKHVEDATCAN